MRRRLAWPVCTGDRLLSLYNKSHFTNIFLRNLIKVRLLLSVFRFPWKCVVNNVSWRERSYTWPWKELRIRWVPSLMTSFPSSCLALLSDPLSKLFHVVLMKEKFANAVELLLLSIKWLPSYLFQTHFNINDYIPNNKNLKTVWLPKVIQFSIFIASCQITAYW